MERAEQATLGVVGPANTGTVPDRAARFSLCTTTGSPPLVIDREEATLLTAAVLHAIRQALSVPATPGSLQDSPVDREAQLTQVLTLAGFHRTINARTHDPI